MMPKPRTQPSLSDEHLGSIGEITVNFARLEASVSQIVHMFIGRETGPIITAGMPFSKLLDLLSSLYIHSYTVSSRNELPPEIGQFIKQATEAETKRNRIVHSSWYLGVTPGTITRIKSTKDRTHGLRRQAEVMKVQDLDEIAYFIATIADEAQRIAFDIYDRETLQVQLSRPLDGARTETQPEFAWEEVSGAAGYEFVLARDPTFVDLVISKTGGNSLVDSAYKCESRLKYGTEYYWKVRAVGSMLVGPWSETWSFFTDFAH